MKGLLKENYFRWFSKYLVVKRASIEPNFHSLYISFIKFNKKKIVGVIMINIKIFTMFNSISIFI